MTLCHFMPPTPSPPLSDRRARTRDDLLVAAQMLLMTQSAGSLGIRQIATAAGMVHGTFYNYYPDIDALIDDLAGLVFASHAALVLDLRAGAEDPAVLFARVTRQTLRFVPDSPAFSRLLFDAGLPVDRFLAGLRAAMAGDISAGARQGLFAVPDVEVAVSLTAGAILGVALDLHRGSLPVSAIEPATARLLESLGVTRDRAAELVAEPLPVVLAPVSALRWTAVPPLLREALYAA
jgi:AcrR family transcriptional regulator